MGGRGLTQLTLREALGLERGWGYWGPSLYPVCQAMAKHDQPALVPEGMDVVVEGD